MRVFVTGASGWIGSAVVQELVAAGHSVVGLARSPSSAASVAAMGASALHGDLDDLDSLRRGAADTDATVHLANKHDWANPSESNRAERAAVETIAQAMIGTDRPFVVASGVVAAETDPSPFVGLDSPRGGSENRAFDFIDQGVRAIAVRFAPTVHGLHDHGFIAIITQAARRNGVSPYIGDGSNGWAAVHRGGTNGAASRGAAAEGSALLIRPPGRGPVRHYKSRVRAPLSQYVAVRGVHRGMQVVVALQFSA